MDVVTAVINREGETTMTTLIIEEQTAQASTGTAGVSKTATKANTTPRKPRVAPSKPKSGKKPAASKKGTKSPGKAAKPKAEGAREGSKTAKVVEQLKRPGGVTLGDLMKATGWQAHSVRGFLSILGNKKGLAVESTKSPDGERTYSIKS
jgi:hypothetical protein